MNENEWDNLNPFEVWDWFQECQGEGRVTTADYESYFGAMYKNCPKCQVRGRYHEHEPHI